MEDTNSWTYIPEFASNNLFPILYQEVCDLVKSYEVRVYGKLYESRRMSCVFTGDVTPTHGTQLFNYNNIPSYFWTPTMASIREKVEEQCQTKFDYCLVHLYRNGEDKIDRHSDKEGLNSVIASLSLGATRKFRFQKIGVKSGWERQFFLRGGDLLIMKIGCQRDYSHWVPKELTVKQPRLNLTFRTF